MLIFIQYLNVSFKIFVLMFSRSSAFWYDSPPPGSCCSVSVLFWNRYSCHPRRMDVTCRDSKSTFSPQGPRIQNIIHRGRKCSQRKSHNFQNQHFFFPVVSDRLSDYKYYGAFSGRQKFFSFLQRLCWLKISHPVRFFSFMCLQLWTFSGQPWKSVTTRPKR